MAQAPELAGGSGFTFEDRVSANYLAAILQEGFAPGIEHRTVCRVALQQRDFGEPLDDVIVDFRTALGDLARLSLQVKRSLTISAAPSNTDFRDVIRDCWGTFKKPDFRKGADRYGPAVGEVASDRARDLRTLCELARASSTLVEFEARFAQDGSGSDAVVRIKNDIASLITMVSGSACSTLDLKDFLAHFVLVKFDFLHEGQVDLSRELNTLRTCLATGDPAQASALWDRLCTLVREGAGRSAVFDRPRLVRSLSAAFQLSAAPSLRQDLERLGNLARQWIVDIEDNVGGTHLERNRLVADLASKLNSCRWVLIRGLPGSGKSVLLRSQVESDLARGPVLFLKSGRLEGAGWASFATANGLSNASLPDLLTEVAATGSSTLYIDGIDRVEKQHQHIILDVVRTIMENPLLDNWRIVISLRDTGIEPLRNWLGGALSRTGVGTVEVKGLDDEEAKLLAKAKPALRPLLFGRKQVQEIARRPFFAKILSLNFRTRTGDEEFQPQSEVDLIENWWDRGGYNAGGQDAVVRQRAIVELGSLRSRRLDDDILFRDLTHPTIGAIDQLVADGILQHVRKGHSLRFSHDIFFEWAFFHVLDDAADWLEEIRACGEPPAVARVVELRSQWEFGQGDMWPRTLNRVDGASMRSQWTRAWLLAPLAAPNFVNEQEIFYETLQAKDHRFLKKALVWFQAERTTPNPSILEGEGALPNEVRIRLADLLAWPSDYAMWSRFIVFLLARISTIPVTLYPDVVSIFEVFQNAFAGMKTPITDGLLNQTAAWLNNLSPKGIVRRPPPIPSAWAPLGTELDDFMKSLTRLIFRSAEIRPDLTQEYLDRLIGADDLRSEKFEEVVNFSPILAGSHPDRLADLTFKALRRELPEEHRQRERRELNQEAEGRKLAKAKPPEERTRLDNLAIEGVFSTFGMHTFGYHDWEELAIDDGAGSYFPSSPLRDPFHSLFTSAPDQALRLLAELSNHAITAWRQLHRLAHDTPGTPVPLDIVFPWGKQRFWGGEREYLWCRGSEAPQPIGCGYIAMEGWALGELERGRPVDELIQQIVSGNECIAVLGVAAAVAIQSEAVTEGVFALVTSQRLLLADHQRFFHDVSNRSSSLIGFTNPKDLPHIDAVKAVNNRPCRHKELRALIPRFFLLAGEGLSRRISAAVLAFVEAPPIELEEQLSRPDCLEGFVHQAKEFAELVDLDNYRRVETPEVDKVAIVHQSPSLSSPERIALAEEAGIHLQEGNLWMWGAKYFETGELGEGFTIHAAINFAKSEDSPALFKASGTDMGMFEMRHGAVAVAAAVALDRRDDVPSADLVWARKTLKRAFPAPEKRDIFGPVGSMIPWHPAIFVARGLAADIRWGTPGPKAPHQLLSLVAHPLEAVSLTALEVSLSLWDRDPKLGWSALYLALSLCVLSPRTKPRGPNSGIHSHTRCRAAIKKACRFYEKGEDWPELPLPPPAWVKVSSQKQPILGTWDGSDGVIDPSVLVGPDQQWAPSPTRWYDRYAAKVLKVIPVVAIMDSTAAPRFLEFCSGQLAWTISALSPPLGDMRRNRSRARLFEWTYELGNVLGKVAGKCALAEVETRFLVPLSTLDGDPYWKLLASFVNLYICMYIYDAKELPATAIELVQRCLDRFLEASPFDPESYHCGEFFGFDQPRLAKTLMFVSIEEPALGAARYANGDWSQIGLVLPVVDKFIRSAGWISTIMSLFLTLCERAKEAYPADQFADQVLHVIDDNCPPLKGWHGTLLPARIAGLVQYLADRETPMSRELGQKFLRILDVLVDMGDRRSAALQLSESFREIQSGGKEIVHSR